MPSYFMGRDWEDREEWDKEYILEELETHKGMALCNYLHILGVVLQTVGKFQVCRSGFHSRLR